MPEFLIERIMPGVGKLDVADLKATSRFAWVTQQERFPKIHWLHSYATDDILYCLYRAPDEDIIQDYAKISTLPVHRISRVVATIDPFTIEGPDQQKAAARQRMLEHARFCRHLADGAADDATRDVILRTATACEEAAALEHG